MNKSAGVSVLWEIQMRKVAEKKRMIFSVLFATGLFCCGKAEYLKTCAACHTESLIPSNGAKYQGRDIPPLAGPGFIEKWRGLTTRDLTARVKIAAR